jgi:uncharacterized protein (TIGR03083 family)
MSKPTTKSEVLSEMRAEREALEALVAAAPPVKLVQPGALEGWSVKDTLLHLAAWEQMFLGWYRAGKAGQIPITPAEGYNWRQLNELNQAIYDKYRDLPLEQALARFHASYRELLETVEGMSEAEADTPGFYAWTKGHALAGWISSNAGNHYRWARKELSKGLKKLR